MRASIPALCAMLVTACGGRPPVTRSPETATPGVPRPVDPLCSAPGSPPGASEEPAEDEYGPARRATPEDPKDLCAVADSNIAASADAVLALPDPLAATLPVARWDHQTKPAYMAHVARRLALTTEDRARLAQSGFVVPARLDAPSYAFAYHEIHQSQLPLYVSLDSIFHAVYAAHDHLLGDIERARLLPLLARALTRMHCGLAAAAAAYPAETARDLDTYLTVARRLLDGDEVATALGVAEVDAQVADLVARAREASSMDTVSLFGRDRVIDFTQLQPRGHYAGDAALEPYFRAAMWLARTELNLVSRSSRSSAPGLEPDPRETPREDVMALALADLAARSGAMADLGQLDRAWELLAGRREDVPLQAIAELAERAGIRRLDAPDAAERLRTAIGDRFQRTARVHYMPEGSTVLPAITTLLGPRIVPDAAATRPLVHSEVPDRHVLHAADLGYLLGQDRAREWLADDLARWPTLARQLDVARQALADAPRGADLYGAWLDAIAGLALGDTSALPSFMATPAYADLRLDTAIAAYAQLRHNHVLVAAQSYDEGGCEVPDGWVEPAPATYDALIRYADRGAAALAELDPDDAASARGYFARLGKVLRVLRRIVAYELAGQPLPEPARRFLAQVVEMAPGGTGGPPTYTGWWFDLFAHREEDGLKESDLVADVYTSADAGISYLGVSGPRLGVFVVDTGGPPRLMVGPVARAFEHLGEIGQRLDDEAAKALPESARHDPWAASYTVPRPPEPTLSLAYDEGLVPEGKKDDGRTVYVRVEARGALGKVTVTLLDHHRDPIAKLTRTVGPGTTLFPFKPRRGADGARAFEGVAVTVGAFSDWAPVADVCGCASLTLGAFRSSSEDEDGAGPE